MIGKEYRAIISLNIPLTKWGSTHRVKVRNATHRQVFIANISSMKNMRLLSKTYKIPIDRIDKALNAPVNRREEVESKFGNNVEEHLFRGFEVSNLAEKIKEVLSEKKKSFKVNINLGYTLINRTDGTEMEYFPTSRTQMFDKPVAINSRKQIDSLIIKEIMLGDHSSKVNYPSSAYLLKEVNSAKVLIYYRNHQLGQNVSVPEIIKKNQFIIDFPNTENKCVFYCLAYHRYTSAKPRFMTKLVKADFKTYCSLSGIEYSNDLFKNFKPIDPYQFSDLEHMFNIGINVYEVDIDSWQFTKTREAGEGYENVMNILEYNNHAMYIKDIDTLMSKYPCSKCGSIFETSGKLYNHKKNKCQFEVIESFAKDPKMYQPSENVVKRMLRKYGVKNIDHYLEDFIVFDFEAMLKQFNQQHGSSTEFTHQHIPISVSICDSLTKEAKCFINEDPKQLLVDMFAYVAQVSELIRRKRVKKLQPLLKRIIDRGFTSNEIHCSCFKADQEYHMKDIKPCMGQNHFNGFYDLHMRSFNKGDSPNMSSDYGRVKNAINQIPLVGFNSGRYDINLIKKDMITVIGAENIRCVIKNPSYMCIATNDIKLLDIINYLPAGTSLDTYLKTYLSGSNITKGIFPYEYISSFERLNDTLPPKEAFDSKLKNKKCSYEDYDRVLKVWKELDMKTLRDLLVWYNNLDVEPMVSAMAKQIEFYKRYDLDMLADGVSLPGLAEKIMYKTCYDSIKPEAILNEAITNGSWKLYYEHVKALMNTYDESDKIFWKPVLGRRSEHDITNIFVIVKRNNKLRGAYMFKNQAVAEIVCESINESFPDVVSHVQMPDLSKQFSFPTSRFKGYISQDKKAGREFSMTIEHLNLKLHQQSYMCYFCQESLFEHDVSADRIDNRKGHIDGNINITCIECNVQRSDMSVQAFKLKKHHEMNSDNLVYSIDEEQKDIYHKMKDNIAGGPSIIFNRYAKRNETTIRGSKLVKKVIGYDANALYLWCLGNDMPCGRLTQIDAYEGIINDIKSDKVFGFLECDIETPEHLKGYFNEMTPIFKNVEIDTSRRDVIGDHMADYAESIDRSPTKSKKLIGSYFGKKILLYTPLLKWYLAHGMIVTKTYGFIKASKSKPFKSFMDAVSNARREGDEDSSKAMIAEMMKLVGNSAFGRSGMDKSKHKAVKYVSDNVKVRSIIESQSFHDLTEFNGSTEVEQKKRRVKFNNPIHLSIAIYQLAKLRMLQFYYDCIDRYISREDFCYQEMDTDSAYIAFSDEHPFENLIKPEMRAEFNRNKYLWFPRDYSPELAKFDKRTPGLFKEEWRGDAIVSLSSKNYMCYMVDEVTLKPKELKSGKGKEHKLSAKGVQQGNGKNSDILNPKCFEDVVLNKVRLSATNSGFRIDKESCSVITYKQSKIGLNYWYDKRRVLADGITTVPLNI